MEIVNFLPRTTKRLALPWQPHLLVPTGDWQYGAEGFWEPGLRQYLRDCVTTAAGAPILTVTTGDMADLMSPSNRRKVTAAGLYDRTLKALENDANRDVAGIVDIYRAEMPEAEHIGFLEGHHYFVFPDGTTTDQRLCRELGGSFLGDCAIVQLTFRSDTGNRSSQVNLWLHHGQGAGSPLAKLKKQSDEMEGIDLFLMGHTPHLEAKTKGRMFPTVEGNLRHRDIRLAGTGGWLRSYVQNSQADNRPQGNYAEQAMLPPVPLGGIKVWLIPWRRGDEIGVKLEVII